MAAVRESELPKIVGMEAARPSAEQAGALSKFQSEACSQQPVNVQLEAAYWNAKSRSQDYTGLLNLQTFASKFDERATAILGPEISIDVSIDKGKGEASLATEIKPASESAISYSAPLSEIRHSGEKADCKF